MRAPDFYQWMLEKCQQRQYSLDVEQQQAVKVLSHFAMALSAKKKLWRRDQEVSSVYLFGGVGRGKSFILDSLCQFIDQTVALERWHFHAFMRQIHHQLQTFKGHRDPLNLVAKQWAARIRLLAFDEFHVHDIADAMILSRLLQALAAQQVCVVSTSNYHPQQLYPDGLQRALFIPAIEWIMAHWQVLALAGDQDYRRQHVLAQGTWFEHAQPLVDLFTQLSGEAPKAGVYFLQDRPLPVLGCSSETLWCEFDVLCGGHYSAGDYLLIAENFSLVLLSGLKQLDADNGAWVKRLVWLIDVLYDQHVKLIIASEVGIEQLYPDAPAASDFDRTLSRLHEMQTAGYWELKKR